MYIYTRVPLINNNVVIMSTGSTVLKVDYPFPIQSFYNLKLDKN